jgi:hypothetical protein
MLFSTVGIAPESTTRPTLLSLNVQFMNDAEFVSTATPWRLPSVPRMPQPENVHLLETT